ncbi:hypothetical protein [Pseudomonas iridis]|uniref:hypothetical protein n=1 Tax=Pseudomonas iridis TaxID=2710587 RepID=UPI001B32F485|nr:hypothetical protein [Pseudomonas iridis]MBP5969916.1 hypothetical protein [Pseudomonas iridis]
MVSQTAFDKFSGFLEAFKGESDRGAAVLTLCVLEEVLKEAIKRRLPDPPNSKYKDAVDNFSPKGRLSASTVNAYMLGVLSKHHLDNFGLLIDVRNKFAHQALSDLSFDEKNIKNWVRDLKLDDKGPKLEGRNRFLIAATEIYFNLAGVRIDKLSAESKPRFQIDLLPVTGK